MQARSRPARRSAPGLRSRRRRSRQPEGRTRPEGAAEESAPGRTLPSAKSSISRRRAGIVTAAVTSDKRTDRAASSQNDRRSPCIARFGCRHTSRARFQRPRRRRCGAVRARRIARPMPAAVAMTLRPRSRGRRGAPRSARPARGPRGAAGRAARRYGGAGRAPRRPLAPSRRGTSLGWSCDALL